MNTLLLTFICAVLFGVYDLFIKLASGSGNPTALAFVVQLASTLTLGAFITRPLFSGSIQFSANPVYAVLAGITIAIALNLLFFILKIPGTQSSLIIPFTLIGRNLVLVILSILILRINLSPLRLSGLILGLISIFLISK